MRYPEIQFLRKKGLRVEERSPWHFQVIGKRTLVTIWPTKKKWMVQYDSGASFYESNHDLLSKVERSLGELDPRELLRILQEERDSRVTPQMRDAYWYWKAWCELFDCELYEELCTVPD